VQRVDLASYPNAPLAYIARALLESEGIEVQVVDEHTVGVSWLWSNAIGGVKLRVAPEDRARARALLEESREAELAHSSDRPGDLCPVCGSEKIRQARSRRTFGALSLLFQLPLFFGRSGYCCEDCGAHWRRAQGPASPRK